MNSRIKKNLPSTIECYDRKPVDECIMNYRGRKPVVLGLLFLFLATGFIFFPMVGFIQASPVEHAPPVEQGMSITVEVPERPSPSPSPSPTPGLIGGGVAPAPTVAIFKGKAYPLAFITLLKNGAVAATFQAEISGRFEKTLTGLSGGMYTFGFWAEDTEGRKSVTISFTIGLIEGTTTTVEGIFIPPTISLAPTQVEKGGIVNISGQAFPGSEVNIFIASQEFVEKTPSDSKGKWGFKLNTSPLSEGEHTARAKALFGEGEQSPFSQSIPFLVLAPGVPVCRGADLNFDGRVNLIDFSILMYWWESTRPGNICVDINQDGIVNIIDFSIMMYWWTG